MKSAKHIIIAMTFLMLVPFGIHAQSRPLNLPKYDQAPYHFGFVIGVNHMNFTINPANDLNTRVFTALETPDLNVDSSMLLGVTSDPVYGFTIGIVSDLRMGKYFNLRFTPALSFGERYIDYSILGWRYGERTIIEVEKNISSTFVDLPWVIKYKSKRLNNMRAYVFAGLMYSIDLASNEKKKDEAREDYTKLKKNDVYFVTGVGFDFYNPWFKFGMEIRMNYGIFNVIKDENTLYTEGLENLTSKIFQLGFTFE